jgi:U3 small nucleolar RNA-associated protein 19
MAIRSIPTNNSSTATTTNKQHQKTIKQTLKQIKETEQQLKQTTNQDLNPIADLLERLQKEVNAATEEQEEEEQKKKKLAKTGQQVTHALIYALHRIFSSLIRQGRIHGSPTRTKAQEGPEEEAIKLVKEWLKTQYSQYIDCLLVLLHLSTTQEEHGTQIELDALTILINLVRAESDIIRALKYPSLPEISAKFPPAGFESSTFLKLVKSLLIPTLKLPPIPQSVRAEFILRYLNFCDDLRFRFLKDAT